MRKLKTTLLVAFLFALLLAPLFTACDPNVVPTGTPVIKDYRSDVKYFFKYDRSYVLCTSAPKPEYTDSLEIYVEDEEEGTMTIFLESYDLGGYEYYMDEGDVSPVKIRPAVYTDFVYEFE